MADKQFSDSVKISIELEKKRWMSCYKRILSTDRPRSFNIPDFYPTSARESTWSDVQKAVSDSARCVPCYRRRFGFAR